MLQTTVGSHLWFPTWWQVVLDPEVRLRHPTRRTRFRSTQLSSFRWISFSGPPAYGGLVISEDNVKRPFRRLRRRHQSLNIFCRGCAPVLFFSVKRAGIIVCDIVDCERKTANFFFGNSLLRSARSWLFCKKCLLTSVFFKSEKYDPVAYFSGQTGRWVSASFRRYARRKHRDWKLSLSQKGAILTAIFFQPLLFSCWTNMVL